MYIPYLQCGDRVVTLSAGVMVSKISISQTDTTEASPIDMNTDKSDVAATESDGENCSYIFPMNILHD